MGAKSVGIGLTTAFCALGCVMLATLIYTISIDGFPFRIELLTRWMVATLIDFYINVGIIGAWVVYKESSWIMAVVWIVLLVCLGSITTCGYVAMQFFKLSPEESSKDPVYFVLVRKLKRNETEHSSSLPIVTARVIFAALGCLMLGTLVYTLIVDGNPFRPDVLTPWMVATLIDFYINVFALSVWVAYKEASWLIAFFWILLMICFGSIFTCAYIVWQLFYLSSTDPVYYVLFSSSDRNVQRNHQPLMVESKA